MLKALLKKQMLEVRNVYLTGRKGKDGQAQKAKNPKGMYVLFIILYVVIMISMFFMSLGIGSALIPAGLGWLYFTIAGILAFLLGVIGSVLSTAQALFRSKDNELLLSMPIPPSNIIFVRMITVYLMSLVYESVVIIPAIIYYFIAGPVTVLSVVFSILSMFVLAFLITAISCGAGWLVSLIASKLKNQKIILVLLGVLLIGIIYYFQFNASRLIGSVVTNAEQIAESLEGWGYPLYAAGLGMTGNALGFLVFLIISAVLFAIAYFAVTKSFSRIALSKETPSKYAAFKKSDIRTSKVQDTLFRRELKRFTSSVTYMMNSGLGILFLTAGAVLVFIKIPELRDLLHSAQMQFSGVDSLLPVLLSCLVCMLTGFVLITGSSISLEGKYLWIYQTLPIDPYQVFLNKIKLHVVLAGIPALLCILALGIAIEASIPAFICMVIFTGMYIVFNASFGLMMDLRKPKLKWTNENQAMKTNITILVDMLIGMLIPLVLGALYLVLTFFIGPELYLAILIAIFAGLTLLVHKWLAGKGRRIFSTL